MDSYATYSFYTNTYKGTKITTSNDFEKFSQRASVKIRQRILNRDISDYEDEIEMLTCSIADMIFDQETLKEKIINTSQITSEKVGDYSKNMSVVSTDDVIKSVANIDREINMEITNYLAFTGLLYQGIKNV